MNITMALKRAARTQTAVTYLDPDPRVILTESELCDLIMQSGQPAVDHGLSEDELDTLISLDFDPEGPE